VDNLTADLAERMRAICLALPEVTERPSHGAPTWFVRGKTFVTLWADGHHENQFPHLWCAALPGAQNELTASAPGRFFRPPYVGGRGWIGVRLDRDPDWAEIAELCQDAYRVIAPARLAAQLDGLPVKGGPGAWGGRGDGESPRASGQSSRERTAAAISAAQPQASETPAPPCP
jgi:hypothetical protein